MLTYQSFVSKKEGIGKREGEFEEENKERERESKYGENIIH